MNFMTRLFGEPVPTVSAAKLQEELEQGNRPFLLDVRQPEEFTSGHIPGAKLIPLGDLDGRIAEVPTGREVVCICASGHRSVPAVRRLVAAGYKASSLENGMMAWQMARLPMKKGMAE
jgi:rhodanese-related sulfurtransferase